MRKETRKRGFIGDVAETLRQAFGRAHVTSLPLDPPTAAVAHLEAPVASVATQDPHNFAYDTVGEELFDVRYEVAQVAIESQVLAITMPQEMCATALEGFESLVRPRLVEVAAEPIATRTRGVAVVLDAQPRAVRVPPIGKPGVLQARLPQFSVTPLRVALKTRRLRIEDGASWVARIPVRRVRTSPAQLGRVGMIRALRALVDETGLAPRDIELIGAYGPLPNVRPARLEVDAEEGILLLWYPLRVEAKGAASLIMGRRLADGKLLAARLPL